MATKSELLILISPPASGKTFWIETFSRGLAGETLLVVSPLRALADECNGRWGERIKTVTPEEWLARPSYPSVVIFDEFHLNFYWGDSFRPALWEVFFDLSSASRLTVLLTATLAPEMEKEISLYGSQFEKILLCDLGNRSLKYAPRRYLRAPSKRWLSELIELGPRGDGVNLIFCAYRSEVGEWERRLKKSGYRVWSCVGGEAKAFRERAQRERPPEFIVATSVLSHGVNLPPISCVYFLYPLKNIDFWIQMVARGGRRGEAYEVFALENPFGIKWRRSANFLAILALSLKMWWRGIGRDLYQWFSKESS